MHLAPSLLERSADRFTRFGAVQVDRRDFATPSASSNLFNISAEDDLNWALCEIFLRDAIG